MILLLLLLAQAPTERIVYTNVVPGHGRTREIRVEIRPASTRTPTPEQLASLKAREYNVPQWPEGVVVARSAWQPWLDRPGAVYDRWRDPDLLRWRRAAPPRLLWPLPAPTIAPPRRR